MTKFLKLNTLRINAESIVSYDPYVVRFNDNKSEARLSVELSTGRRLDLAGEEAAAMLDYLTSRESRTQDACVDLMARHEAAAEEARLAEPAHQLSRIGESLKGRFPMLRAWVTRNGNSNRLVLLRNGFHAVVVEALPEGGFGITMSEKKVEAGMDFYFGPEKRVVGRDAAFDRVVSLIDADTVEDLSDPGPQNRKFFL